MRLLIGDRKEENWSVHTSLVIILLTFLIWIVDFFSNFWQVPFRLTRDVIDGMGVTGVEGVFRKCCEETLSVMRTNKEALLTIVEVIIHHSFIEWIELISFFFLSNRWVSSVGFYPRSSLQVGSISFESFAASKGIFLTLKYYFVFLTFVQHL